MQSTPFHTEETRNTPDGKEPLMQGLYLDFGKIEGLENKQNSLLRAVARLKEKDPHTFKPPYIVMDLAAPKDVVIRNQANVVIDYPNNTEHTSDTYGLNPVVKILVPACQVVDVSKMKTSKALGGHAIVKCNSVVPVYRWFQAANLLLHYMDDKEIRLVPFPIQTENGVVYHMLPVNPQEFTLYEDILQFGVMQQGVQAGFETSGKMSYEILGRRGVKRLTAEEVDHLLTHVMLGHNKNILTGIMLHRAGKEDLEDLQGNHFIYY